MDYSQLLSNREVCLPEQDMSFYNDKVIMVTGAGGSIGSEICRQLLRLNVRAVILFGRNENNLFWLEKELNDSRVVVKIGSVTDAEPLESVFVETKPDVVFHAAANKHVPLCEKNVYEAYQNNLYGTYNLYNKALSNNVKHFVFISTDKACNPKGIMGITKRLSEIFLLTKSVNSKMQCSVVRFGNVLGSSGSVIPIFEKQIKENSPITITDFRMTRYFMTIPEASALVLYSTILTNDSKLNVGKYMLDMGDQIKILDLAHSLIRMHGNVDIQVIESGIRPGEKLSEELSEDYQNVVPTKYEKVLSLIPDYNIDSCNIISYMCSCLTNDGITEDNLIEKSTHALLCV